MTNVEDGSRLSFMMPQWHSDDIRLDGVLSETYRPCPTCPGETDAEFKTVSIYRVDGLLPWWLTLEVHHCQGGHSDVVARRTAAVIRPAVPADPASPEKRMFSITGITDKQRSILACTESDNGYECEVCGRPWGITVYEPDVKMPSWASPEIFWCIGCGHGHVYTGVHSGRLYREVRPLRDMAG
ncbi:hypothetical protein [Nocardia vaccinii]|uniref:hypothetical protein n=1 Tax=Nocardia vaccinii TaxID=1822 RepID=UPI000AB206DE|nr:hypothetical protein [Nocardia vaccinii]